MKNKYDEYKHLKLEFKEEKIFKIIDLKLSKVLKTFQKPLTNKEPKLYVIKDKKDFIYVGVTHGNL